MRRASRFVQKRLSRGQAESQVYERGIELFHFPIAFEIWNIYLSKFVKRYGGKKLERARDLFEQALENCPPKYCKPLFLMYAKLEEEHGLAKRSMGIYDRAASVVQDSDKMEMYTVYIAKATANFGLPATRPIYERALEALPDKETAEICTRFARMERKLGEIDRARAIYAHASQFCDPRVEPTFWAEWNSFESEWAAIPSLLSLTMQSTRARRIRSARCYGSSDRSKLPSTPKPHSLPHRQQQQTKGKPRNRPTSLRQQRRTLPTRWLRWSARRMPRGYPRPRSRWRGADRLSWRAH